MIVGIRYEFNNANWTKLLDLCRNNYHSNDEFSVEESVIAVLTENCVMNNSVCRLYTQLENHSVVFGIELNGGVPDLLAGIVLDENPSFFEIFESFCLRHRFPFTIDPLEMYE